MYPDRELTHLARRTTDLRQRIAAGRRQCAGVAGDLMRPVAWLDRTLASWYRLPTFARRAAWPLSLLVVRVLFRRRRVARTSVRWGSLLLGAMHLAGAALAPRQKSSPR